MSMMPCTDEAIQFEEEEEDLWVSGLHTASML